MTNFEKWDNEFRAQNLYAFNQDSNGLLWNGAFIDEDYFKHLLSEIREIRMSERRFYQKLTDIYATSIDYNRDAPTTRVFYKKMQNKMHFAVHGKYVVKHVLYLTNIF